MSELPAETRFSMSAAPPAWADYADELKSAADILWREHYNRLVVCSDPASQVLSKSAISRSYILLAGFALENVLKGIIVASDPSHVAHGRLSRTLQSHKVMTLAEMAGEPLSGDERRFCILAEEAIPYWARYPIPLRAGKLRPEAPISMCAHRAFECLFARTRYRLYQLMKDGWDSGEGLRLTSCFDSTYDSVPPAG